MYKIEIGAYKDFEKDIYYSSSEYIPRKEEIIDNYKIEVCEEDDSTTTYICKLEVLSVHYELFDDTSAMPVVYANIIKCEELSHSQGGDE